MKSAHIVFLALLFSTGQTLTQSQTSPESSVAAALDPTKRISQYVHTTWRIQDGVLPGLPEAITQTADGYLWIGTFGGLVRFDGVRMVPWDGPQLPDSRIFSVRSARDGSLWIGTPKGAARWKQGQLTTLRNVGGRTSSILEDHTGAMWIGRTDVEDERGGVCQIVGRDLRCYHKDKGMPFRSAQELVEDRDGSLWVASYQGLCRWKPESSETLPQEHFQGGGLMGVVALAMEKNGTVWAGVERPAGGLTIYRLVEGRWRNYQLPGVKGELDVTRIFVDRDQTVWIGTARRGIYRVRGSAVDHFGSGDGLSSDAIANFFQDREGTLWIATSKGVDSFRDVRVATYSIREGLSADSVSLVQAGRDGTLWIGNSGALDILRNGRLSSILTEHGLPGRDITTLFEDRAGRLWIGIDRGLWIYDRAKFRLIEPGIAFAVTEDTEGSVWARVDEKLERIENLQVKERMDLPPALKAHKMAADPSGGIWLGLTNGDLVRYRRGKMETFHSPPGSESGIRALIADSDGFVSAATQGGLLRWKDGASRLLTTRNGLPCDDVYTLVRGDVGSLWLYASCGVIALSGQELQTWWAESDSKVTPQTVLDVFDGAQPGLTPAQPQATRSTDGRLWFANDSVLQIVDPRRLGKNLIPPPILIQHIIADKKHYSVRAGLELPPRTRDLEIAYAALSFVAPLKVRYRYKLEGHDQEWQDPGSRREAIYNDLPPGKYTFRVIACNNDGIWNEAGATVGFSLSPAFYQTNWFLLLCAALGTWMIWVGYRWRVGQISARLDQQFEERLAERTRIAQDLHDTLLQGVLSASMQLHIVDDQLPKESPAKPLVTRVLELMGRVVDEGRNALRGLRSAEGTQSLDQAFARIPQELAVHQAVDFRVVVEGQSRALHPVIHDEVYRICREALANAFRHSQASSVVVAIEFTQGLRIAVRDDGCGIDPQVLRSGREGHFGLQGMHERARRIGSKLTVSSRPAAGTEVTLAVPANVAFRTHSHRESRREF